MTSKKKTTKKQLQQLQKSRTVNRACIHIKPRGRALVSSQRCLTDAGFFQDYYFNHSVAGWAYGQSQLAHVPGWPSSVAPVLSSAEQMALRWSTPLGVGPLSAPPRLIFVLGSPVCIKYPYLSALTDYEENISIFCNCSLTCHNSCFLAHC